MLNVLWSLGLDKPLAYFLVLLHNVFAKKYFFFPQVMSWVSQKGGGITFFQKLSHKSGWYFTTPYTIQYNNETYIAPKPKNLY